VSTQVSIKVTRDPRQRLPPQSTQLKEFWLAEEGIPRKGYHVVIHDSVRSAYSEYEGIKGTVQSVFVSRTGAKSTAEVMLNDNRKLSQIPIEFLWPLRPSSSGDRVVSLFGKLQGKAFRVLRIEGQKVFLVNPEEGSEVETELISRLCKWSRT
jgi:hypothetical protein